MKLFQLPYFYAQPSHQYYAIKFLFVIKHVLFFFHEYNEQSSHVGGTSRIITLTTHFPSKEAQPRQFKLGKTISCPSFTCYGKLITRQVL